MTVASEIARLQGVKANILDAIAAKGVTVPSGSKLDDAPDLIASISVGGETIPDLSKVNYAIFNGATLENSRYIRRNNTTVGNEFCYPVSAPINGKSFHIHIRTKFVGMSGIEAIIGVFGPSNYGYCAIHYDTNQEKIWLGFPDSTGSSWQSTSTWKSCVLNIDTYYDFDIVYDKTDLSVVFKVNNIVIDSYTLNESPLISNDTFAFGRNYNSSYLSNLEIDTYKSYVEAEGILVWGSKGAPVSTNEFEIKTIAPVAGIYLVDNNGYIGYDLTNYFQTRGATFYYNYAILSDGDDFSSKELGQVTFYTPTSNVIGGRTYRTVIIGGKEWLAENLDFKFSGLAVGQSGTSSSEPRGNYYLNDSSSYGKYGILYNWLAVKYLEDNKTSLIPGWHVPTTAEWDALATAVGGTSVAGTKLKSTTDWSSSAGTDDYGFSALPAGYYNGNFFACGSNAGFWTATESSSSSASRRSFDTGTSMGLINGGKNYQYSVRLVKDTQ